MTHDPRELIEAAARILCEEQLTDYRQAKLKAAARLGLGPRASLPDSARVRDAVIRHQQLFGGQTYLQQLHAMRAAAVSVMRLLAGFDPCLVGGALSGAITPAHRVQLQAFSDAAEALDLRLLDLGIRFDSDERVYHYPDGARVAVPLCCFTAAGLGVDLAVLPESARRRAPLCPVDGRPFRRARLAEVEALLAGSA
ncbi:MAG: hypothetical protein ACLGHI_04880 [Gammaproteobacteria bacterium]